MAFGTHIIKNDMAAPSLAANAVTLGSNLVVNTSIINFGNATVYTAINATHISLSGGVIANNTVLIIPNQLYVNTAQITGNVSFVRGNTAFGGSNTTPAATVFFDGNIAGKIVAMGVSNSHTVNCASGTYFTLTGNGATSVAFANAPNSAIYTMMLIITGGSSLTWSSSPKWPSGSAPTKSGNTDIWCFLTDNGGATWRGNLVVKDSR